MARIIGFEIQNFGTLRDIKMGQTWYDGKNIKPLTPLTVLIGKNGAGKSTLLDVFVFLADCLKFGVEEAFGKRGGYGRVVSQGAEETITIKICYGDDERKRLKNYEVSFALDEQHQPYVKVEALTLLGDMKPTVLLSLQSGGGVVWSRELGGIPTGENFKEEFDEAWEVVKLDDSSKLGIAVLGALKTHPHVSAFRRFVEGWYLSYFTPDAARGVSLSGPQRHLSIHGDNMGNVVQFMKREHPERFQSILDDISQKIPGVDKIDVETMPDGRLLLKFNDKHFANPFSAQQMSDGTLKVFAYLLMLADPSPATFICIEEPENGLYPKLLEVLAHQFREHVTREDNQSQIFITTHQPYLVDALEPDEVWILEKGDDGFAKVRRASDDPIVNGLVAEDFPLGGLWYSDYLEGDTNGAL